MGRLVRRTEGLYLMTDQYLPDTFGSMTAAYGQGRQIRADRQAGEQRNRLAALAPQVLNGDPTATAQAFAIDPEKAKQYGEGADRLGLQLHNIANQIKQMHASGNEQGAAALYAQAAPMIRQKFPNAPAQWDPTQLMPAIDAVVAMTAGEQKPADLPSSVQEYQYGQKNPGFVDFLNGRQPTQLTSIPVQGGTMSVQWNPRTKTMTDLQGNPLDAQGNPVGGQGTAQGHPPPQAAPQPGVPQQGANGMQFTFDDPQNMPPAVVAGITQAEQSGQIPTGAGAVNLPQTGGGGGVGAPAGRLGFKPDKVDPGVIGKRMQELQDLRAAGQQFTEADASAYLKNGSFPEDTAPVLGDASKTGDAYLATLPPQAASQVKALAEGRMQFPSGTALKSPYWQGMLSAVSQFDPNFDAVNYNARSGTRKAFTSGKEAQTVNALNTVAEHLGKFSDNAAALHNTGYPVFNHIKNFYLSQTGDPSIAAFNTNKKAVADEVAKVWRASGGSESDIQENLRNLDGAQSPEQLNAAIGTLTELIYGKVAALQDQYASGMGTTQTPRPLVSPGAQAAFDKTLARMHGEQAPSGSPKVIKYDAQGHRLP